MLLGALLASHLLTQSPAAGELRVSGGTGYQDLIVVSWSVTALVPLELEAGWSPVGLWHFGTPKSVFEAYAAVGARLKLLAPPEPRRGLALGVSLLGGARVAWGVALAGRTPAGAEGRLALNATWWLTERFGPHAQASVGGTWWLTSPEAGAVTPDARLSLGVAF
jgi:hypothetical protein